MLNVKDNETRLRWIGNLLLLVGYFILLFYKQDIGLSIRIIGAILLLPSFIKLKLYDLLFIASIFLAIDIAKLLEIIFL